MHSLCGLSQRDANMLQCMQAKAGRPWGHCSARSRQGCLASSVTLQVKKASRHAAYNAVRSKGLRGITGTRLAGGLEVQRLVYPRHG